MRNDEVGQTGEAIMRLLETLRLTFNELLDTVSKVDLAARRSGIGQRVAAIPCRQRSASAMAAAIEEMTVSINHITESAASRRPGQGGGRALRDGSRPSSAPPPRWPPSPTKCSAPRW
jgi:methyl-accepting chemotaxis protein